jgi:hypothetical protein
MLFYVYSTYFQTVVQFVYVYLHPDDPDRRHTKNHLFIFSSENINPSES